MSTHHSIFGVSIFFFFSASDASVSSFLCVVHACCLYQHVMVHRKVRSEVAASILPRICCDSPSNPLT